LQTATAEGRETHLQVADAAGAAGRHPDIQDLFTFALTSIAI